MDLNQYIVRTEGILGLSWDSDTSALRQAFLHSQLVQIINGLKVLDSEPHSNVESLEMWSDLFEGIEPELKKCGDFDLALHVQAQRLHETYIQRKPPASLIEVPPPKPAAKKPPGDAYFVSTLPPPPPPPPPADKPSADKPPAPNLKNPNSQHQARITPHEIMDEIAARQRRLTEGGGAAVDHQGLKRGAHKKVETKADPPMTGMRHAAQKEAARRGDGTVVGRSNPVSNNTVSLQDELTKRFRNTKARDQGEDSDDDSNSGWGLDPVGT